MKPRDEASEGASRGERREVSRLGELLRAWRAHRRLSQMDLAFAAGISPRHLSFIETGRSAPSRDVVLRLAHGLDLSLRDRNVMLEAAGYSRMYRDSDLSDPALGRIRRAVELMLARHEPYSAVVVDRTWNLLMANAAHERIMAAFIPPATIPPDVRGNLLRLVFDPRGLRPYIGNWDEVCHLLLSGLYRQVVSTGERRAKELFDRLVRSPGVPRDWDRPLAPERDGGVIPLSLSNGRLGLELFSLIAAIATPLDVALEELRVELFFPADDATDRAIRRL